MELSSETQLEVNREIAKTMGVALGLWFAPVVSAIACDAAERRMLGAIGAAAGCGWGEPERDAVASAFKRRHPALAAATYAPGVGAGAQVLEAYALGRFAVRCIERGVDVHDGRTLAAAAEDAELWSGAAVVQFYESFAESRFPDAARERFVAIADGLRGAASGAPGAVARAVAADVGGAAKAGVDAARSRLKKLFR